MKRLIYSFSAFLLLTFAYGCTVGSTHDSAWGTADRWYMLGEEGVDVFYLVSTEVLSAEDEQQGGWRSTLSPTDRQAITAEMDWVHHNMFDSAFRFVSPYYHQFTFDALCSLSPEAFDSVYQQVSDEAFEAFSYYAETINPDRPFILAGFSQGAMLCTDILRRMTDEQYARMIACYSIGYRITREDLCHPHFRAAERDDDGGVVISFNSVLSADGIWPMLTDGAAACINPVNWRTDATPALFCYDGTTNTIAVDTTLHVLMLRTDSIDYYHRGMDGMAFFYEAGVHPDNLHHWDLLFFPQYIGENALLRADRF